MANLPQELIFEILLLLPVKSLLHFKRVSKWFSATINSQDFINMHLKTSSRKGINRILFYLQVNVHEIPRFYRVHALDINNGYRFSEKFQFDIESSLSICPFIHASCNGLVLFPVDWHKLAVLNPSTREYKNLPFCPVEVMLGRTSLNFGYDSSRDEYKVVVIQKTQNTFQVWIFGFKSGLWRRIQDFTEYTLILGGSNCSSDLSSYRGSNCFVDGALHFLCYEEQSESHKILSLDVAEENFSIVSGPVICTKARFPSQLQVVEGCLCLRFWSSDFEDVEIYVRKKNEVEFTWNLLCSIRTQSIGVRFGELLGCSKERDEILFLYKKNIYSYNLTGRNLKKIEIMKIDYVINSISCIESLVPINCSDSGETKMKEKKVVWRNMKKYLPFSCIGR